VVATTRDTLNAKLDASRKELLNLGLRNPLLNFRPSKVRGVDVVDELSVEVFRILVQNGKNMTFAPALEGKLVEPAGSDSDDKATSQAAMGENPSVRVPVAPPLLAQPGDEGNGKIETRHRDSKLQTDYISAQLQARLLKTYLAARTHIEEQGVNILFLTLGMLTWYEAEQSSEPHRAPLVLVPARLERSDALDKFHLAHTGEDIGDNLSLITKLKNDFSITLPSLPELEDLDLSTYFAAVRSTLRGQPRWVVEDNSIGLGFFSFGKFLMYKDLDAASWPGDAKPGDNTIMKALLDDGFGEHESPLSEGDQLDQYIKPADVHTVINADSTQTLAILDVNRGSNLVIQGPPGTGKSQTITNLIAEAIGSGKKVLFVSEKMAALEVVKRRLDGIGLGDACLELHSNKTNKKSVLQELSRTLTLGKPKLAETAADLQALEQARERLNAHTQAINTPVGESGVSPYAAYGRLLLLQEQYKNTPIPTLQIPGAASWGVGEFRSRRDLVGELEYQLGVNGTPRKHPFWGGRLMAFLPTDQPRLGEEIAAASIKTEKLTTLSAQLATMLGLAQDTTVDQVAVAKLVQVGRQCLEALDPRYLPLQAEPWKKQNTAVHTLLNAGTRLHSITSRYENALRPEAWTANLVTVRQHLDQYGRKWWRFLSGPFRAAQRETRTLFKENPPSDLAAQLQAIDDVIEAQQLRATLVALAPVGAEHYGAWWQGEQSNWETLQAMTRWLETLFRDVQLGTLPSEIVSYLASGSEHGKLAEQVHSVEDALSAQAESFARLEKMLDLSPDVLRDASFATQAQLLRKWAENVGSVFTLATYNNLVRQGRAMGLEAVVELTQADDYTPANLGTRGGGILSAALERTWLYGLLERAYAERPLLVQFSGTSHELTRETFRSLDQLSLQYNRTKLVAMHWQSLPRPDASGQLRVLKREIEKKSRHLPIRQLLKSAGSLIQQIKPVFMMSPLSIATYLSQDGLHFDLVVFDEASQVRPVDAFGAVLRGTQVVVVGDSKQLPPTSFFDSLTSAEDFDQENTTSDMESILGLFIAQSAPQRMLRWHYRSRHESLIAVSNHEFYDDRLVVFPSPDASRGEAGLVYHHLPNTAYDAGHSRTNREEADAVAQAVMEHARKSPQLTLGVAAFSTAQMQAIIDRLEVLRRENPASEDFFAAHPHEPFFVKNLETVQGDERDVIFISIGYGRTAEGKLAMNFGPLNRDGGERRLNVLITRARIRCQVFTNLTAEDIDLERSNAQGVRSLKQFLNYARTGNMDVPTVTGREPDSPFEEAVIEALRGEGYVVRPQVGSAGFFIDIAVVDQNQPGRYLLGIECDGATYHSARSARDRDRLRQQVLEGLGWKIHRIWSTDWFRDPRGQLRAVVTAIEAVRVSKGSSGAQAEVQAAPPVEPVATETVIERDSSTKRLSRLDEIPKYKLAQVSVYTYGRGLDELANDVLARYIVEVVKVEGPVHRSEVFRRIANGAGVKRIGNRIEAALTSSCAWAIRHRMVEQSGDFLWPTESSEVILRSRAGVVGVSPKLEMVAPEEIALAIRHVIADGHELEEEKVYHAASKLLGYARVGEEMRVQIQGIIAGLVQRGELNRKGGLLLPGEPK